MAKSKRNRVVALTKTKKAQLLDKKGQFIKKIHDLVKEYKYVYSFTYKNMTTLAMQSLRQYFRDDKPKESVFLLGKSTVMQVALGKDDKTEIKPNMSLLGETLRGNSGLFFSNREPEDINKYFQNYTCPYFPTQNTIANQTIVLKKGLPKELSKFPSSSESYFRNLGLKVKLDGGKFYLLEDYIVCQEGKPLKPEQVKALRLLDMRIDEFRIRVLAYNTKIGDFKVINENGFVENKDENDDKVIELN